MKVYCYFSVLTTCTTHLLLQVKLFEADFGGQWQTSFLLIQSNQLPLYTMKF